MAQPSIWDLLKEARTKEQLFSPADQRMVASAMPMVQVAPPPVAAQPPMQVPAGIPVDFSKMKPTSFSLGQTLQDKEYEQAVKDDIEERRGGVKGMQAQIDALKAKDYGIDQVDLAPLMALSDSWSGGQLSQNYKRPEQKEKDQATIAKLEEAMRREKGEITGDMIQLLKEKSSNANMKLMMDSARQNRFDESLSLKKEDNIRKDVNRISDEYQTVQGQLNFAENAVMSGDTRGVLMVISSIARNVGDQKGSLSDGDVARSFPNDAITSVAQLEAFLGRPDAKISGPLQQSLMTLIQNARVKSNAIAQESIGRRKTQYSAGAYAPLMQQGQVGDVIFQEAQRGFKPAQSQGAAPTAGVMSPQDWLKKKRGQ